MVRTGFNGLRMEFWVALLWTPQRTSGSHKRRWIS